MPLIKPKIYTVPHPYWECEDLTTLALHKNTSLPFCYLVSIEGMDLCKVGSTGNIRSRLGGYQTGLPFKIDLAYAVSAPNNGAHMVIEKRAHCLLRERLVRGEWFACTDAEAIAAIRDATKWVRAYEE